MITKHTFKLNNYILFMYLLCFESKPRGWVDFSAHIDGNGVWDADEVNALYGNVHDKVNREFGQDKERFEKEMERSSLLIDKDSDGDGYVSFSEYMADMHMPNSTIQESQYSEKKEKITQEKYQEFRNMSIEVVHYLQSQGLVHHPITRQKLLEQRRKGFEVDENFEPKVFFMLYDVDGNGLWDADEVKAMYNKEFANIIKDQSIYGDITDKEMEMTRMLAFVHKDLNSDGFIDFGEFMVDIHITNSTNIKAISKRELKDIENKIAYQEFQKKSLEEVHNLKSKGLINSSINREKILEHWRNKEEVDKDLDPKALFMLYDIDGNGFWDADEFKALFDDEYVNIRLPRGVHGNHWEREKEISRHRLFADKDLDHDGLINFSEFMEDANIANIKGCKYKKTDNKMDKYKEFQRKSLEEVHNLKSKGLINSSMSREKILEHWRHKVEVDKDLDPKAFFMLYDIDGNGVLDADEFKALFDDEYVNIRLPRGVHGNHWERQKEISRHRLFVDKDLDHDGFINFSEFMEDADIAQIKGWKYDKLSTKMNKYLVDYQDFHKKCLNEVLYMQSQGLIDQPESRENLLEIWKKGKKSHGNIDKMLYFMLHDVNKNGVWDAGDVKALFTEQYVDTNGPKKDLLEKRMEMERNRIFGSTDRNGDALIDFAEFMMETERVNTRLKMNDEMIENHINA